MGALPRLPSGGKKTGKNPTDRAKGGVKRSVLVEASGVPVGIAVDGANRNDNKYIDNSKTYRSVIRTNSIGVEFVGNYPDVAKPATAAQAQAWLTLVRFLQERYDIAPEHIYAHNWIDYKDRRYCEGCELATLARKLGYEPGKGAQ